MKFVTYKTADNECRLGLLVEDKIYDVQNNARALSVDLPSTMIGLLNGGSRSLEQARTIEKAAKAGSAKSAGLIDNVTILAPVPDPPSCRDAYAFRQHVATARRNRGVEMIPEFDQYPVFYFTNHLAIIGEGDLIVESDHLRRLDFELEAAVVIGRKGRNITSKEADDYIAGYTIMNDLSARELQMEEMKLNLGPAKGKDFATAIGPWLVTVDELEDAQIKTDFGNIYDLKMTATHNGRFQLKRRQRPEAQRAPD